MSKSILIEFTTNKGTFFARRDYAGQWDMYDVKGNRLQNVSSSQNAFGVIAKDPIRVLHSLDNWDDMVNLSARNNLSMIDVLRNTVTPFLAPNVAINSVSGK